MKSISQAQSCSCTFSGTFSRLRQSFKHQTNKKVETKHKHLQQESCDVVEVYCSFIYSLNIDGTASLCWARVLKIEESLVRQGGIQETQEKPISGAGRGRAVGGMGSGCCRPRSGVLGLRPCKWSGPPEALEADGWSRIVF